MVYPSIDPSTLRYPTTHSTLHFKQASRTQATMAFGLKSKSHILPFVPKTHFPSFVIVPCLQGSLQTTPNSPLVLLWIMPLFDPRTHPVAVILLAFVLAAGFLLVILSCALWNNWLPLLVGTCYFSSSTSFLKFIAIVFQGHGDSDERERQGGRKSS
jgi:hypothetical protein